MTEKKFSAFFVYNLAINYYIIIINQTGDKSMKKIIALILIAMAFSFAIEAPSEDVIALADYLDKYTYNTKLYGERSCEIRSTYKWPGSQYVKAFVKITVFCGTNHSMAYRLPNNFGKLEKLETHNDGWGSYAEYYYIPAKYVVKKKEPLSDVGRVYASTNNNTDDRIT